MQITPRACLLLVARFCLPVSPFKLCLICISRSELLSPQLSSCSTPKKLPWTEVLVRGRKRDPDGSASPPYLNLSNCYAAMLADNLARPDDLPAAPLHPTTTPAAPLHHMSIPAVPLHLMTMPAASLCPMTMPAAPLRLMVTPAEPDDLPCFLLLPPFSVQFR